VNADDDEQIKFFSNARYHELNGMKIALIADIHSNAEALSAVLTSAKDANAEALMIAGDLIGYYFEPAKVLDQLLDWEGSIYIVRGNHEELMLAARESQKVRRKLSEQYGPGIDIAIEQLSEQQFDWVRNLPHPLIINEYKTPILLCHGSPGDINCYIYPDTPTEGLLGKECDLPRILVMGHTHYPMITKKRGRLIINPGSVGQPRNGQPGAHWTILDTDSLTAEHKIEPYNVGALLEQCTRYAPNHPYLRKVLERK